MSQNRDAPAYQEYAATILAQLPFRTMTLQDRGLLYTMRLECWVNVRLPQNHNDLAKVLGVPVAEIDSSLVAVMPFFEVIDGFIISPELENYRAHLADRKNKQSHGGKLGSAITNNKRKRPAKIAADGVSSTLSSTPRLPHQDRGESLVQQSTGKPSQNQSPGRSVIKDSFVAEYEAAEKCTAEEYAKASGSG
ncbi:hypothetical protein [Sulfurirhabdus autotrophica]|uniref:Uncharacterized protein n=1 Tax=Sulfurirhabdus autotrophica TaxID=1706046 RepID=A0A4V2W0Z6_9PROT|nr:hypothetical protein [Sulfurirhabdus autotrophica]TCV81285.1 hypothetical protein EDC63_12434 [Sulfurirhabdus autotrophica]